MANWKEWCLLSRSYFSISHVPVMRQAAKIIYTRRSTTCFIRLYFTQKNPRVNFIHRSALVWLWCVVLYAKCSTVILVSAPTSQRGKYTTVSSASVRTVRKRRMLKVFLTSARTSQRMWQPANRGRRSVTHSHQKNYISTARFVLEWLETWNTLGMTVESNMKSIQLPLKYEAGIAMDY